MKFRRPKSAVILAVIILLTAVSVLALKNTETASGAEKIVNILENEVLEMEAYIKTLMKQVQIKIDQIKAEFSSQVQDITGIGRLRQQQEEYQKRQRPGGGPPGKGPVSGGF